MTYQSPEMTPGAEYASQEELLALFETGAGLLRRTGQRTYGEPNRIIDFESGIPTLRPDDPNDFAEPDSFEIQFPNHMVEHMTPLARQELQMLGGISIYFVPRYMERDHEGIAGGDAEVSKINGTHLLPDMMTADTLTFRYETRKADGNAYTREVKVESDWWRKHEQVHGGKSDRKIYTPGTQEYIHESEAETTERLGNLVQNVFMEYQLGANQITTEECESLLEIVHTIQSLLEPGKSVRLPVLFN